MKYRIDVTDPMQVAKGYARLEAMIKAFSGKMSLKRLMLAAEEGMSEMNLT